VRIPIIISLLLASASAPAFSGDGPDWLDDPNDLPKGVVTTDTVMVKKDSSPFALTVAAERAMKSDKPDLAISIIKRALELEPDDADSHMIYATALERKLQLQHNEDPKLFNQCVKEWLSVLRNQFGEEKATNFHGIGIPGAGGKWFEDEDRHRPARQHLIKLTGFSPKPWETNEKFLAKVLRSGETSVSGKVVNAAPKKNEVSESDSARTE